MIINLLVAVQIAVPHTDITMITGLFVIYEGIADRIRSAISGAIQGKLLSELQQTLQGTNPELIQAIYEEGVLALADYPLATEIRTKVILAWEQNMYQILVAALVIAAVNFLPCFFLEVAREA